MSLRLRGKLTAHVDGKGDDIDSQKKSSEKIFWFENENNKKSSFVFDESSWHPDSVEQRIFSEKPCHLFIDCCHVINDDTRSKNCDASTTAAFLFGGLEVHSNSRNIEVYALGEESKDNKSFDYLKTSRGTIIIDEERGEENVKSATAPNEGQNISSTKDDLPKEPWEKELYRTIIIPPDSKPIPILRLQLKLLSLRPAKCTVGYVKLVKLKGRLPDVATSTSLPQALPSHGTSLSQPPSLQNQNRQQNHEIKQGNESFSTQTSQITNAISAITMLIQNTQQTMEKSISTSVGEIQKMTFQQSQHFHTTLQSLERNINEVNNNLNELRNEVHTLINIKEQKDHDKSSDDSIDVDADAYENDDEKDCDLVQSSEEVNDEIKSEKSMNNLEAILQEYFDKMQESNKREMEQLLINERKILLHEMERKRDELINEVTQKLNSDSNDNTVDEKTDVLRSSPISLIPPSSPKVI